MIRAAIVGMGRWGQTLIESVQDSDQIRFVAGISRDPDKLADYSNRTGIQIFSDLSEVLANSEIDAIVLASPHSHHAQQIIDSANSGKHVFVEKPMALTQSTAQQAADACIKNDVVLGVGFNRRVSPAFLGMQKAIQEGRIGEILHIEGQHSGPTGYRLSAGNWRATRAEAPAGGMTARGIHTLDGMIAIGGHVSSIHAISERNIIETEIDDTTAMLLRFKSGITGYLATVFVTADLYRLQIYGSKGWVEMLGPYQLSIANLNGEIEKTQFPVTSIERGILEAFANSARAGTKFVVDPQDAVNGIAVLEAIVQSADQGKTVNVS